MFVNGSQALKQVGGQLKQAGAKAPGLGNAPSVATPSVRKHRKLLKNTVDAYREVSAIDTTAHEARTQHTVSAVSNLAAQGHHNIQVVTPHGSVTAQSTPRDFTGDRSQNPSADVYGDPHAGAPFHQGGYYSAHNAHVQLAAGSTSVGRPTATPLPAAPARPILALPAGTGNYEAQAGTRPGTTAPEVKQPFTSTTKGEVLKPGQKPLNLKTPEGPERTFVVGKQGPLHTRETTPGVENSPIAKKVPLNAPYGGPDDGKKKKRAGKKKTD